MRGVKAREAGGPEVLEIVDLPDPEPGPGEVVIAVAASAVNRADVMQRRGFYPPPNGVTDVLGLECSGHIAAVGEDVERWQVGDPVCALLAGGGYADTVVVPAGQVLPVPDGVSVVEAAALPEVACTVWSNVFMVAGLQPGETLLVHGGAGGIGTFAIQLAKQVGATVACTVGSAEKGRFVTDLGADLVVDYNKQDFVAEVTAIGGADVILDNMGAAYLERNVDALAIEGRLVVIGLQGGTKGELNLGAMLSKRAAVVATSLRSRPVDAKAAIVASVEQNVWPLIADGSIRPIIHETVALSEVHRAHEILDESSHIGKLVLTV